MVSENEQSHKIFSVFKIFRKIATKFGTRFTAKISEWTPSFNDFQLELPLQGMNYENIKFYEAQKGGSNSCGRFYTKWVDGEA